MPCARGFLFIDMCKRKVLLYDIQEEIVEPAATLKFAEGKSFIRAVKKFLGTDD